ncbi:alpha/beta fold hydrolase [Hyphococcus sp. DH-69]|uniref:alpha/beta fold hydrolase n=1 Tax=Hyphococcus formosus TaxID=3143534 RepID=UPI00398A8671
MTERIVQFGDNNRLHGIMNIGGSNDRPTILLFNAGIVHRIGAHRLNVKLARNLADQGYNSIRFDLSGLGDSAPAPSGLGYEEQAIADIASAMDRMVQEAGAHAFVAIGMCSGADNAYRAALSDQRLRGLILLDPYAYENPAAALENVIARATDIDRWKRKAKKIVGLEKTELATPVPATPVSVPSDDDDDQARPIPPLEEFGSDLEKLCNQGTRIFTIYTGFVKRQITKPEQFFSTFASYDFKNAIDVDVFPAFDHTYTDLSAQEVLFAKISDWLGNVFPPGAEIIDE